MKHYAKRLPGSVTLLGVASLLLLAACSSNKVIDSAVDENGVPNWVTQGSNIFKAKDGRLFHGVGSSPGLGDFSLQTGTADLRARAEVARILASYMEIVSRDFIASGEAEQVGFTEQHVAEQMDNLAAVELSGVRIIGHWQDKERKVVYSIAEMDLQSAREALKKEASLHEGLRAYISAEGNDIFDRLAKSVE